MTKEQLEKAIKDYLEKGGTIKVAKPGIHYTKVAIPVPVKRVKL